MIRDGSATCDMMIVCGQANFQVSQLLNAELPQKILASYVFWKVLLKLVGGLEHVLCFQFSWEFHNPS